MAIRNIEQFALRNEETIINKKNEGNRNFEMFKTFFQECKEIVKGKELII